MSHQRDFRRNRSTIVPIFCIFRIVEKKWECSVDVHKLLVALKRAYDSVRREALYNILSESGIPTKMIRLIKMCLNETCS